MRSVALWIWLFPRNVFIAGMKLYRKFISPLYGDVCRYYPTCSHYALISYQRHGVLKGVFLSSKRILSCHPWAAGGVDDVPESKQSFFIITESGFVKPMLAQEKQETNGNI